ncbi:MULTISPECIES: transposase [Pseudomonadota]|uniref:transposase n=1 Tax=Pseudomonadota TaxID=1224 RepID=UPI001B33B3F7|nr:MULTISPECIES: transposase [Pseudomonadota]MBP3982713.1 transposase [Acidovorax sp. JG5]MCO2524950.1 transposase [Pseudomonas aeruginosa]MCO7658114.1 transposase [Pseudomonas aeruginosa]HBO9983978.1 transposase [Pseudomonas aeruginosa]HBP0977342.1 transposase [Pseudomonas aeruginosa]
MSEEIPHSHNSVPRTRRAYSAQFKAELIAACRQPGASIAATAREHGMNANVLHRWLREHRLGLHQSDCDTAHAVASGIVPHRDDAAAQPVANVQAIPAPAHQAHPVPSNPVPAFIAVALGSPVMGPQAAGAQAAPSAASAACSSDIRIECCHHGTRVTVNWPLAAAAECSRALQGLLQVLRQ